MFVSSLKNFGMCALIFFTIYSAKSSENPLSCDIYLKLNLICKCQNDTNYLKNYGWRNCEVFRRSVGWTRVGSEWRDQTIKCLQQRISSTEAGITPLCDCQKVRKFAFETHSICFTQRKISFCTLPRDDVDNIYKNLDPRDLRTSFGFDQSIDIVSRCLSQIDPFKNK